MQWNLQGRTNYHQFLANELCRKEPTGQHQRANTELFYVVGTLLLALKFLLAVNITGAGATAQLQLVMKLPGRLPMLSIRNS